MSKLSWVQHKMRSDLILPIAFDIVLANNQSSRTKPWIDEFRKEASFDGKPVATIEYALTGNGRFLRSLEFLDKDHKSICLIEAYKKPKAQPMKKISFEPGYELIGLYGQLREGFYIQGVLVWQPPTHFAQTN